MISALVLILLLIATAVASLHFVLVFVGLFTRTPDVQRDDLAVTVIIPAHDEELTLPTTLASLANVRYPQEKLRVLVVADNCTDSTAAKARAAGIDCLERTHATDRGKGYALIDGLAHSMKASPAPDAILILDADCTLEPETLPRLMAALAPVVDVVQAAVLARNRHGASGYVAALGSELDNLVGAGEARLGLAFELRGTGMLFRTSLFQRIPWQATGITEDAEYSSRLRQQHVQMRFVLAARVHSDPPASTESLLQQRRRWRQSLWVGGTGSVMKWLKSKPITLAYLALILLLVPVLQFDIPTMLWLTAILAMTVSVYLVAMKRVGRPTDLRLFIQSFGVVAKLFCVTMAGLFRQERAWKRTERIESPQLSSPTARAG